ncbi:MAG: nitroreductase family protein [Bacteroidia bacterium]|nr:nitroreductase family protein [Bacteroidia bacterium]
MELYEGLLSRRSIRKYTGEKIDEGKIQVIIKAGMYAPSARNRRPWHFIVIDDKSVLKSIMNVHPYASMLSEASHAIVVCGDETQENGPGYYKLDCSAASQNILLAAHSLGIGAVWLGIEPKKERIEAVSRLLGLPSHIHPLSIISLGVPVKIPEGIPDRFEPEKIRRNKW